MIDLRKKIGALQSITPQKKRILMLIIDMACLTFAALLAAYIARYNITISGIAGIIAIGLIALKLSKTYKVVVSHIGRRTYIRILLSSLLTGTILFIIYGHFVWAFTAACLMFLTTAGWRFARTFINNDRNSSTSKAERLAIYGAGEAGMQAAAGFRHLRGVQPVCFFDDNPDLKGRISMDIPIYTPEDLEQIIIQENIDRIILAIPSASRATRNQILSKLENSHVPIQTLPGMRDILSGSANISDIRDIDPLDLLGRDPVPPNEKLLKQCITGKNIMVTGAGGSIGSELCRQIIALSPKSLVLFDVSEYALYEIHRELEQQAPSCALFACLGSVQDKNRLEYLFQNHNIETVYHAAAYKHVPIVEENVGEAIKNNAVGTMNAAESAIATGVKTFVLISTDKAVRPTSAMGATKRLAEMTVQALSRQSNHSTHLCFVRFGNVLASSGSVIPLFRQQIASGGPVTVTHPDMVRYFMSIPEAAQLVLQAGALAKSGDGFTLDMGDPVKIVDMARRMIRLSGHTPKTAETPTGDIEIVFSGLRPGEKLYEELFINEESSEDTDHPRIRREIEAPVALKDLKQDIEKLLLRQKTSSLEQTRKSLFECIDCKL